MRELESGKRTILDQSDGDGERKGKQQPILQQIVIHSRGRLYTHLTAGVWNLSVLGVNWATCFPRRICIVLSHEE